MSTPFIGQISVFSFGFAPRGWATCDGQLLSISQNAALFSLLGTTYGGNGVQNFALPNLQARTPLGFSSSITQGASAGESTHTLTVQEMPVHAHAVKASAAAASTGNPANAVWANASKNNFTTTAPNGAMNANTIASAGSSQAHENTPPFLGLNFCIALVGIFPSRS